jgi:hypothetical protein
MFNPRVPRRLQLTKPLSPEEVSLAWLHLFNLSHLPNQHPFSPPQPLPPRSLRKLSDSDWHLLNHLLAQELELKDQLPLH